LTNNEEVEAIWRKYEEIRASEDFNANEQFVLRADLPDDLIREIVDSEGDLGILNSLASNQAVKLEFLEDLYYYRGAITKEEDSEELVLLGLSDNRSAGEKILKELAEHENPEIAESAQRTLSKM
jgi:hypothetical protein